jgi:replicative DNA helicase
MVFPKFEANTVHIRRGQLTLIAAAPGVGKSLLSLAFAMGAQVPAFYFSADTDAFTMYLRAASHETGWKMEDIENTVKAGRTELIDAKLNSKDYIRWSFEPNPTQTDIEEELLAYVLTYGEWPHLIVVDNLRNVYTESGGEDMDELCDWLHALAKKTGAAVIALHHVKGPYNDGNVPIPLSGLIGQIGKVPEMILTLHKIGSDISGWTMNVSVVKNRTGKGDPSGGWFLSLLYEPERMKLVG